MKNVQILTEMYIIGDIRERLGAVYENDTQFDNKINQMSAEKLIELWSGWNLGDESWGREIIEIYKNINKFKKPYPRQFKHKDGYVVEFTAQTYGIIIAGELKDNPFGLKLGSII